MSPTKISNKLCNWPGGGTTDLAETAATILDGLGKQEDTLGSENDLAKRIRVIQMGLCIFLCFGVVVRHSAA